MMRVLSGLPRLIFTLFLLGGTVLAVGAGLLVWNDGRDLPSHEQLLTYVPATGTRVYAADGSEIAEFAAENRIVVPLKQIPPVVIHAFLAAEDRDFYSHGGINPFSILRAAVADLVRYQRGQRPLGASTITQQLVRHFLLSNRVSMSRKIKEALLAYKIERYLSKDRILEIYLNEIYLGAGAYGVAAAAETYFDRPLDRLDLAEAALLAALPKAPNLYNPFHNPEAAKARRDWVLAGMAEKGWISAAEARAAMAEPVELHPHTLPQAGDSGYFAEEVRRELIARFGEQTVYQGGLTVRTSYTPADQAMAERAFRDGLVAYDRRHGWRGPLGHFATVPAAVAALGPRRGHRRRHRRRRDRAEDRGARAHPARRIALGAPDPRRPAPRPAGLPRQPGAASGRHRAGRGAAAGRRQARPAAAAVRVAPDPRCRRRRRRHGAADRARAGDDRRLGLPRQPVQPRHPGQAPARLGDQAVRLRHRARQRRIHPVDRHRGCADRDRPGPRPAEMAAGQLRRRLCRRDDAAPGAGAFAQPGDGAAGDDDRAAGDRPHGRGIRHHGQDAAVLFDGARRRRDHGAPPDRRLRDARQRRALAARLADRPGAGPHRQGGLPEGRGLLRRLLHRRRAAPRRRRRSRLSRDAVAGRGDELCRALRRQPAALPAAKARPADRPDLRLPDRLDDGRGGPARHRHQGRRGRQAARRQDRHVERLARRLVRRLLAQSGGRRVRRLRQPEDARRGRDRRQRRGTDLPRFHGGGVEGPARPAVQGAGRGRDGPGRPGHRPARHGERPQHRARGLPHRHRAGGAGRARTAGLAAARPDRAGAG